jgi:hypothetical protein
MSLRNNILILGDSTSMTVGIEKKVYPFIMADCEKWPKDMEIVNCSIPGFTSADALAFFYREFVHKLNLLSAVIIYLGNCDSAQSEVKKGRYDYLKRFKLLIKQKLNLTISKTKLRNRLLHYEWNNSHDASIESPESPKDFEYNIQKIIEKCQSFSVPVILIKPKANFYFPPGLGKGNFIFYKYLGLNDCLSDIVDIPDQRFKDALRSHESGRLEEALKKYEEILLNPSETLMSTEYSSLILNNYAVAKAEFGEIEEAIYLFGLVKKESAARKEIAFYNIAQIKKICSDPKGYSDFLLKSFESDESLYRIRSPYIRVLNNLSQRFSSVIVVDMEDVVSDDLYLDHCHPLPEGQVKLSNAIMEKLSKLNTNGSYKAKITNNLYNPELSLGNLSEFHHYFKTYANLTESDIAKYVKNLKENLKDVYSDEALLLDLPREIKTAFEYYLRHPFFPRLYDALHFPPRYPSDIGRFPEFFIIRSLIPYIQLHELNPLLADRFKETPTLLRTSSQLISILPLKSLAYEDENLRHKDSSYDEIRLSLIILKSKELLISHLQMGCQIYERKKSTIFWYVREALRFGAHSRVSMLYDRLLIEFVAEGLAVAGVIDYELKKNKSVEIESLVKILHEIVRLHEKFCSLYLQSRDERKIIDDYKTGLSDILKKLKAN